MTEAFTDEMLTDLKQNVDYTGCSNEQTKALLVRLEAAEKIVELATIKRECGDVLGSTDALYDATEAWKASKGEL